MQHETALYTQTLLVMLPHFSHTISENNWLTGFITKLHPTLFTISHDTLVLNINTLACVLEVAVTSPRHLFETQPSALKRYVLPVVCTHKLQQYVDL